MTAGLVFALKDLLMIQTASGVFIGILILLQNKECKPQKKEMSVLGRIIIELIVLICSSFKAHIMAILCPLALVEGT